MQPVVNGSRPAARNGSQRDNCRIGSDAADVILAKHAFRLRREPRCMRGSQTTATCVRFRRLVRKEATILGSKSKLGGNCTSTQPSFSPRPATSARNFSMICILSTWFFGLALAEGHSVYASNSTIA